MRLNKMVHTDYNVDVVLSRAIESYTKYITFHLHFGSDVTSASFVFNWLRGRGPSLKREAGSICRGANTEQVLIFMWCHYQSAGERLYKKGRFKWKLQSEKEKWSVL